MYLYIILKSYLCILKCPCVRKISVTIDNDNDNDFIQKHNEHRYNLYQ